MSSLFIYLFVFKNNYEITMEDLSMKCDPCLGRGTLEETSSSVLVCVSSDIINIWEGHVACNPAWDTDVVAPVRAREGKPRTVTLLCSYEEI